MSIKRIAIQMNLTPGRITHILTSLEAKKWYLSGRKMSFGKALWRSLDRCFYRRLLPANQVFALTLLRDQALFSPNFMTGFVAGRVSDNAWPVRQDPQV